MEITLEYYDHTCADGCCYTTGYDVFVDGEKIGSIGEDAQELADLLNETFNTKEKDMFEEITDIIDSENSGLSAEQRLDEINRLIKDFNTKER
jgi:hypothetical protein